MRRSPKFLNASPDTDGSAIVAQLELLQPRAVIALLGGASGLSPEGERRLERQIVDGVAQAAAEVGATVVDGGTESGIMGMLAKGLRAAGHSAPYIGVAPSGKVRKPGSEEIEGWLLSSYHTHFVCVEGDSFGDETPAMYALIQELSRGVPSLAILANGGDIAKKELEFNIRQGREVIVLQGSGRLADEVARTILSSADTEDADLERLVQTGRITLFELSKTPDALYSMVRDRLVAKT